MQNKKKFSNAADEFFSKPQEIPTEFKEDNISSNAVQNTLDNTTSNILDNAVSNRAYVRIEDILDNIKDDRNEGSTHSFYLSDKIYNTLVANAKAKKMSTSKFLEGILRQLFADEK